TPSGGSGTMSCSNPHTFTYTHSVSGETDGDRVVVTATITDDAGNKSTSTPISYIVDKTPPTLVSAAFSAATNNTGTVSLTVTASETVVTGTTVVVTDGTNISSNLAPSGGYP